MYQPPQGFVLDTPQPSQPGIPRVIEGPPRQPAPRYPDEAAVSEGRAATVPYDVRIAAANAEKAEAEAAAARAAAASGGLTPAQMQSARSRYDSLSGLDRVIGELEGLYQQNLAGGQGGILGIGGDRNLRAKLPLAPTGYGTFDAAAGRIIDQIIQAFDITGGEANSVAELRARFGPYMPASTDNDETIRSKLNALRDLLSQQRQSLGRQLGEVSPATGAVPPAGAPPSFNIGEQMDATTRPMFATGPMQTEVGPAGATELQPDPVLAGVNSRVSEMIQQGAPIGQVLEYTTSLGIPVNEVMAPLQRLYEWKRENPRYNGPYTISFENRVVPVSTVRQAMSTLADNPIGAGAVAAMDTATGQRFENVAGLFGANEEMVGAGVEGLRERYPISSLVGDVGASIGLYKAGGAALSRFAPRLAGGSAQLNALSPRAIGGDAALGAYVGSGQDGTNLFSPGNALTGAVMAGGGGIAARGALGGGGRLLTGARNGATRYLTERGVPLTIGQMAGQGGPVGRTLRAIEDKLESIPLLGDAIRSRRMEGYTAVNRAAFDDALEPIGASTQGQIAEEGVEVARSATGAAYDDALRGVSAQPDNTFVRQMRRVMSVGQRLPDDLRSKFEWIVQNRIAPALDDGSLSGTRFQALRQELRQDRAAVRGDLGAADFGKAVTLAERTLERLIRRRAPEAVPALNRADRAYRRSRIVEGAVGRGQNNSGVFSPAQLGQEAKINARRFDGTQATTERPFFELQRNAQDVLPSTVPNSGTMDRAWVTAMAPAAIGGAGYGTGVIDAETAALMGALGLPYTQVGQRTLQKLIVERPEVVREAGERILNAQRLAGQAGAGAAAGQ